MTRTSQLDFGSGPDADMAGKWDTKCKLFSLVEVCTILCAVLVTLMVIINAFTHLMERDVVYQINHKSSSGTKVFGRVSGRPTAWTDSGGFF